MASSRGSSNPVIEPRFPTLQVDSLLMSHQGSPRGTSRRPLASTRELPKRGWPRGPTGQGLSVSSLALFPLSGSMSPLHPPAPGLRHRGEGTQCLSELCKLPFLINIDIENTFIAMKITISQRDRSHVPTHQVLKFMGINSRIQDNRILLYGFEKARVCLKNPQKVCKKRKAQIRGKFRDSFPTPTSLFRVDIEQECQEDPPLLESACEWSGPPE